ncbi:hypothetical protein ACFO25_14355 [Paenactinomyces guangxiensis]|uniref:Uncharacterized protein n=1 Tax=Paenactinomyces guangxiensis TaxID=1490290 RepID=A0A7W2A8A1_9BACL|nr:hypothetical protein [Paenactinomyces guangxiensis]MBA4493952.1 hypothetical protein [Paenactinomyces guangxiensis]MBH8591419.1 hypothetical protein [Paenactinomyces guangxiensis]
MPGEPWLWEGERMVHLMVGKYRFDHSPRMNAGDSWVIPSIEEKFTRLTP